MLVRKGLRYRVFPTNEQVATLVAWSHALRALWNLALEQRLLALARPTKRYYTAFDQGNELTALRAEVPWLAAVPRNVSMQLLVVLDDAWQRCFHKLAKRPRWKRRDRDAVNLCEPHPKVWRLSGSTLHFPKLGPMRAVVHRPLEGTAKTCTIVQRGDQWFASIVLVRNRHLARSILDAGWGRFVGMLRYKMAWSGGQVASVVAAYSSQTCSACGVVDARSRRSQSEFVCLACGAVLHAAELAVTACGGFPEVTGPAKQEQLAVTRATRHVWSGASKSPGLQAGD